MAVKMTLKGKMSQENSDLAAWISTAKIEGRLKYQ